MVLWTEKYRPVTLDQIAGNKKAATDLLKWYEEWTEKQRVEEQKKKSAIKFPLLVGPPGSGKTSAVYALANTYGLDVIEVNASDKRGQSQIQDIVGLAATEGSLYSGNRPKKLILIDEVDGVSGREDRGGIAALIKIFKEARVPIIATANDPYNQRLSSFRRYCTIIKFQRLRAASIKNVLKKICKNEDIVVDDSILLKIAENSGGDLRSAINDLQAIAMDKNQLTENDLSTLTSRDHETDIFNALKGLFSAKTVKDARMSVRDLDIRPDMLLLWINENAAKHAIEPETLAQVYDAISRADLFRARIRKRQQWTLLKYVYSNMIEGVANPLKGQRYTYQRYGFPTWVSQMSRTKEVRGATGELAATIGKKCHTSKRRATKDYIPFIKWMFNDLEMSAKLTKWFNFSDDDLALLTEKKNIKEIKKEMEKLKPPPKPAKQVKKEKKTETTKKIEKKKVTKESKEKIEKESKKETKKVVKKVRKKLEEPSIADEEKPKHTQLDKWF
ncbi:replication factor C large subunit [Candidatus Borrarchaeum sp.]|uniref:replication factor C large subunit n=1 Tax=Candidatus Borrarchaeum sp. TaxID=2846742 RepID=UPI00257D3FF4|nr:replication factor C large subunit [Candidatus Borrarchaeum sp.]